MKSEELLEEFELLSGRIGVKIIKGKGDFKGGNCTINEEKVIVINNNKPIEQRLNILAKCFIKYDLDKLYIVPALRAYIDDCQTLDL